MLSIRIGLCSDSYRTRRACFETAVRKLREACGRRVRDQLSSGIAPARFVACGQTADPGHKPAATVLIVVPRYCETLSIPILSGRAISEWSAGGGLPILPATAGV